MKEINHKRYQLFIMISFVRHDTKAWTNNEGRSKKYGFDPPLVKFTGKILEKLPRYSHVYCSPYRRCRQTMKKYNYNTFEIVPEIREYLGNQDDFKEGLFTPETYNKIKKLKFKETYEELENRVIKWIDNTSFRDNSLVITHGIVIGVIKKYIGKKNLISEDRKIYQIDIKTLSEILNNKKRKCQP